MTCRGCGRRHRPCIQPEGDTMKPTQKLHDLGQSLWLDNITRELLNSGTLKRYIDELSVTGLTSNPTIFDHAIKNSAIYDDDDPPARRPPAKSGEDLFFDLALADLTRAADLFQPVFDRTDGVDGWVSLEVSPLLAHDTKSTLAAALDLHKRAGKPNLFIKIPGTPEGLPAIEEAIFAGVPVNVTLLFSREQYVAAAEAYLRGVERRIAAGLEPGRRLGRLALRQPLGCRGRRQGAGRAHQPARHRHRPAHLQGLSRAARFAALPARRQCRRPRPAPAVGQHRHQGPEGLRHPLCEGARRALHGQHHAGGHAQGLRRSRRGRRDAGAGRRRLRDGARRASPRRASTSTRSPPGSRTRARRPSSSPGTS